MTSKVPEYLRFTMTHEWLKHEDQQATMGITEHAQDLLGDLVFVELPEVGEQYQAGEEIGVVESVKAASDIYAPISGTVVAVNEQVRENPAIVNQDPYGAGWLVKMQVIDPNEIEQLLDTQQYEDVIAEEH